MLKKRKYKVRHTKKIFIKKKYHFILGIVITLIFSITLGYFFIIFTDNSHFETSFYQITSDKIESRIRIVQISDLHLAEFGKNNQDLIDKITKLKPDIITLTGDLTNDGVTDYNVVIDLCKKLVEICPVYFTLGNAEYHDYLDKKTTFVKDVTATGVHTLINKDKFVDINGNKVQIIGIAESNVGLNDKFGTEQKTVDRFKEQFLTDDSAFRLLLIHYPEVFLDSMKDFDVDLALAGHAHGGQIRLPYIGGLYSHGEGFLPTLTEGLHKFECNQVIISRGLGNHTTMPRFNNKPELVVVDISKY